MAEFNDSLMQFNNVIMDLNENPARATNQACTSGGKLHEFEPPESETLYLTKKDVLQATEVSNNSIKIPDEVITTDFDILSQSDVDVNKECNVSTTVLDLVTISENHTNSSDMLNERNINELNACDNHIKPLGVSNEFETNQLNACDNHIEALGVVNEIKQFNSVCPQVSENPLGNQSSDSGIHDWENNVENTNVPDFTDLNFSDGLGSMITDFKNEINDLQMKDEEFHDAVQFFKDPSSFSCLEKAGSSSAPADPLLTRSSLYVNFDPLHAKFFSQLPKSNNLCGIVEDSAENFSQAPPNSPNNLGASDVSIKNEVPSDNPKDSSVPDMAEKSNVLSNSPEEGSVTDLVNKHLNNVSPRESLGNILISFDSPLTSTDVHYRCLKTPQSKPQKLHTEEEFQQALKIQELTVQETYLKNQHDLEIARSQKQKEMENKIQEQNRLCIQLRNMLEEFAGISHDLSDKNKTLRDKLKVAEDENDKLKEDLKTYAEDLQSVESTFADFHKRYEQSKNMLKKYSENEGNLILKFKDMKDQLLEKEEMYKVLQSKTQEMLDKANLEVTNAKRAGEAQAAVLKAQLKKAELKISSLESDVKHIKIENSKLSSICDDLMAKVSEA